MEKNRKKNFILEDKDTKGFTLVELIVVLVILAILTAVAIPILIGYIDDAREKEYIVKAEAALASTNAALTEIYNDGNNRLTPSRRAKAEEEAGFEEGKTSFTVWTLAQLVDGVTEANSDNTASYTVGFAKFVAEDQTVVIYKDKQWTVYKNEDEAKKKPDENTPGALSDDDKAEVTGCPSDNYIFVWKARTPGTAIVGKGDDTAYDPEQKYDADTRTWRDDNEFDSNVSIAVTFHGKPQDAEDTDANILAFNDLEGNPISDDNGNYTLIYYSTSKFANEYDDTVVTVTDRRYNRNVYTWKAPLLGAASYPKDCFSYVENSLSVDGVLEGLAEQGVLSVDVYPELVGYELNVPVLFSAYNPDTLSVAAKAEGGQTTGNKIIFKVNMLDLSKKVEVDGITTNTENYTVDVESAVQGDDSRAPEDRVAIFDDNWRVKTGVDGKGMPVCEDVLLPLDSTEGDSVQARVDDYIDECTNQYLNDGTLPTGTSLEFVAAADIHRTVFLKGTGQQNLVIFVNGDYSYDITFSKNELGDEIYDVDHNKLVVKAGHFVETGSNAYSFLNYIDTIKKTQTSTVSRDNVIKGWQLFECDKDGNDQKVLEGGIKKDQITSNIFSCLYSSPTDGKVAFVDAGYLTSLLLPNELVSQYTGSNQDYSKLGVEFEKLAGGVRSKIRSICFVDPKKREDYKDLPGFSGDICISKTTLEKTDALSLAVDDDGEFIKTLVDEEYPSYIVAYSIKTQGASEAEDRYDICVFSEDGSDMKAINSFQGCFKGCSNMETNNFVEHIDTSGVTRFKEIFSGCSSLTSLDLTGFDISHSSDASSMFNGCSSMTWLGYSAGFNTRDCKYFEYMFQNCKKLGEVPDIDISNAYDILSMFKNCQEITSVNLFGAGKDTASHLGEKNNSVRIGNDDIKDVFVGCTGLKTISITGINASQLTSVAGFFKTDALRKGDTKDDKKNGVEKILFNDIILPNAGTDIAHELFKDYQSLKHLDISGFVIGTETNNRFNLSSMFKGCKKLAVEGDGEDTKLDMTGFIRDEMIVTNTNSMFDGCESLTTVLVPGFYSAEKGIPTKDSEDTGSMFKGCISLINVGGDVYVEKTKSINSMFYNCSKLTEIKLIGSASGEQTTVTDTSINTFYNCISAQKIWVQNIHAPQVTSLEGLFDGCEVLKSVDISTLSTGVITNTKKMFHNCKALTGQNNPESGDLFNLGTLDMSSVKNMYGMFQNCTSLNVDMEIKINSATDIQYLFDGCSSLKKVILSGAGGEEALACPLGSGSNDAVKDAFKNTGIEEFTMKDLYFGSFISSSTDSSQLQSIMTGLRGAKNVSGSPCLQVVIFDNVKIPGQTSFKDLFNGANALRYVDLSGLTTGTITSTANMFKNCKTLRGRNKNKNEETGVFEHYFALNALSLRNVESMYSMFEGCEHLECVPNSIYTVNAKNISYMFKNCSSTEFTDAGTIHIDNATSINELFNGCSHLTDVTLTGTKSEDAVSTSNMGNDNVKSVFTSTAIANLTVQNINFASFIQETDNGKSGGLWNFLGGTKGTLENVKFIDVTLAKVQVMDYQFESYTKLKSIEWKNVKAPKLRRMKAFCQECKNLTSVTLYPLYVPEITNFGLFARNCSKLNSVSFGSYGQDGAITGEKVIYLDEMFNGCGSLTSIDLSSFDPKNVKTDKMFLNCNKLTTITVTDPDTHNGYGFTKSDINSGTSMFSGCTSLKGGNGTTYSSSTVGSDAALVDKSGQQGYFTAKTSN